MSVVERKKALMIFGGHDRTDKRCHDVGHDVMMVIEFEYYLCGTMKYC